MAESRPRGRGAALRELMARAKEAPGTPEGKTPPPSEPPKPSGRGGGLLERLRAREAAGERRPGIGVIQEPSSSELESKPSGGRGRAAILQKLQAMRIGSDAPTSVRTSPPKPRIPQEESEEDDGAICKFMGTSGTPINVTANYIRLQLDKEKGVFEYEVIFSQAIDSKNIRIKIVNSNIDKLGGIKSFDGGHCLYLPIKLPDIDTHINTVHPVDGSDLIMTVKYKKQKKMKDCLHLFNTLFKRIMRTLLMFQFNRNYFDLKSAVFIPQHKLEVLPGFAVTCEEYDGGLMLCLDAQHRVLRTQTVYELLIELKTTAPEVYKNRARDLLIGSSVLTRYNTKNYIIDDILWDSSPRDTFKTSTGQDIAYMDYYKFQHNLAIKDAGQPLLLHKQKLRKGGPKDQAEERLLCLVPELCHLTGLTDQMRADFKVMQKVAEHTRLTPNQRMDSLKKYVNRVNGTPEARKILSDWGLMLQDATIDLQARVLNPEKIRFGNGETNVGPRMDWSNDMAKNHVCSAVDLLNWAVIHTERDMNISTEFAKTMTRIGQPMGCTIKNPQMLRIPNDRTATIIQQLNAVIRPDLQCIVIICPTQRQDLYNAIKKLCCVQHPVASQVILSRTLSKPQRFRAIIQKIALQINCKLGGTLWSLPIPVQKWMVIGIDTYHSPGQNFSWYGFVASLNDNFTRYYSTAVKQTGELGDMVKICFTKALVRHREVTGYYPEYIVVFRDGVGDGQLQMCKTHEVGQLEDCLQNMELSAKLCFVVVQKRINTRLFGKTSNSLENPRAGTVMDHTITKRHLFDYYLVSQHVGQGTVAPTHYICLHNTANLKADIVQKLSYKMCHLYYNWSGTIRVPAPCQYAHKLAFLVGQCIQSPPDEKLSTRLYYL